MTLKTTILETLSRDDLKRILDDLGIDGVDRRSVEGMRAKLSRARSVSAADLLGYLRKDEIKEVCETVGVSGTGKMQDLIDRLVSNGVPTEKATTKGKQMTKSDTEEKPTKDPPAKPSNGSSLDLPALEQWLWDAACTIRGPIDAPKYKNYILPLIFLKRLSDVFDDEVKHLAAEFGDRETAAKLVEQDHKLVRFYIPPIARWEVIAEKKWNELRQAKGEKDCGVGEHLTDAVRAVARENPRLSGVIDVTDFNATTAGQRIVDDGRVGALVNVLSDGRYRLGLEEVEPDILGRAYEYLLRMFAEGQGKSGGEQFTPTQVGIVMARILDPQPGNSVYDPCCGSGGLLIKCHLRLLEKNGQKSNGRIKLPKSVAPLKLFGQEIEGSTYAIARMNAVLHDMEAEIRLGDTMHRPAFTNDDSSLRTFDLVTANPMWNQKFPASTFENDSYERFKRGIPPSASADWGWVQHMLASVGPKGRLAIVLDTGAVSRGSGNSGSNKERDVRKAFVEADLIEAVILFKENMFYNTTAPGIVLVVNRKKRHPGEMLFINASRLFSKGRPKNFLEPSHIEQIASPYLDWQAVEGLSAIITNAESAKNDYNLSPSRYISTGEEAEVLPLDEAVVLLAEAEEERAEVDQKLDEVLTKLGFKGWRNG
ncbi:MAG: N-6 DNA methylase [Candidatus Paceibacterota bacterium]